VIGDIFMREFVKMNILRRESVKQQEVVQRETTFLGTKWREMTFSVV
jgi:hypothetical protein